MCSYITPTCNYFYLGLLTSYMKNSSYAYAEWSAGLPFLRG